MIVANTKILGLIIILLIFFFLLSLSHSIFPQEKRDVGLRPPLDTPLKTEAIEKVGQLLVDNYIRPETAVKMRGYINKRLDGRKNEKIDDVNDFARVLPQDLRSISKDKHIR